MRVADRYIGWQIIFGTILGVTMLTLVLVLGQIFKEVRHLLVERGAPPAVLAHFILLVLPSTLMFTLPWGFLVSTLLSFGRLSANNELIGLRMAGLSLRRIALPVMVVAIAFSGLCYWINGTVSPAAKGRSKSLISDLVMQNPRAFLQPGVVQSRLRGQRVYVEHKNPDETLGGFHLYQLSEEPTETMATAYIHAGKVDLSHDEENNQLSLILKEVFIESTKSDGTIEIALASEAKPWFFDLSKLNKKRVKPSYLTNHEIPKAQEELKVKIADLDDKLNAPTISASQRENHISDRKKAVKLAAGLSIEPHKRASLSLACLAFAFIGVPLGISARRRETSTGLMVSLLIAALYFSSILFLDKSIGASREIQIMLFWLPNIVCLGLGCWLFHRASSR